MPGEKKLQQLIQAGCPVFYFYSAERYLVRRETAALSRALAAQQQEEVTVLDGAAPEIEQLIMAAGTISFFGGRRTVVLPELEPSAYSDKDLEAFCDTLASVENAVLILGSVFESERGRLKLGKRAQKLIAQCKKLGYAEELASPNALQRRQMLAGWATEQGASLSDGVAEALLTRCGEDLYLLENEVHKLAALAGYKTITPPMVAELGVVSLEADVFEMVRMITARNAAAACKKLQLLLRMQQEPVAIAAALAGSYIDLYRVKLGQQSKKSYSAVFKDFGYKGSDYRIKRSAQTASSYSLAQLRACLAILLELDQGLKGQPVSPQVQLETALCRLAMEGVQ